jgi:protein tyrosine/serine phosphatase
LKFISILFICGSIFIQANASFSPIRKEIKILENFHEIDPGKYYRSAQPKASKLEKYIQKYNIKTVINLRGKSAGEDWYDQEVEVLQKYQVPLISIAMNAERLPHRQDLLKLLEAFESAERPILLHCQAGVDRTGEASAIYQMLYMGKTQKEAMKMLSFYYGHIESLYPAKSYFIEKVWQGLDWALNDYDPCQGEYDHYDTQVPECQ